MAEACGCWCCGALLPADCGSLQLAQNNVPSEPVFLCAAGLCKLLIQARVPSYSPAALKYKDAFGWFCCECGACLPQICFKAFSGEVPPKPARVNALVPALEILHLLKGKRIVAAEVIAKDKGALLVHKYELIGSGGTLNIVDRKPHQSDVLIRRYEVGTCGNGKQAAHADGKHSDEWRIPDMVLQNPSQAASHGQHNKRKQHHTVTCTAKWINAGQGKRPAQSQSKPYHPTYPSKPQSLLLRSHHGNQPNHKQQEHDRANHGLAREKMKEAIRTRQ